MSDMDGASAPGSVRIATSLMDRWRIRAILAILAAQNILLRMARMALFGPSRLSKEPTVIVAYRTGRLGDFINSLPSLAALRKRFPDARIAFLTTTSTNRRMRTVTAAYLDPIEGLPWLPLIVPSLVNEARVLNFDRVHVAIRDMRRSIRELKPQAIFLLPNDGERFVSRLKKLLFFGLAGIRMPLYGIQMRNSAAFGRRSQYVAGMYGHEVMSGLLAIQECHQVKGVSTHEIQFSLSTLASDTWAANLQGELETNGSPVVVVAPGAPWLHKRWPARNFATLSRQLADEWNARIIVVGTPADKDAAQLIYAAVGPERCVDLCGRTTILELAALCRRSAVFVGNDSGPAHLASASGCPAVTVTGAIDFPGRWEPWSSRQLTVRLALPCQFCLALTACPLGTQECITTISIERVRDMCERALLARSQVQTALAKALPNAVTSPQNDKASPNENVPASAQSSF